MNRALLVPHQQVAEGSVHQHVVNLQDDATWMAKDGVHPFLQQTLNEDFCAAFLHHTLPPQTSHRRLSAPE
jgi:hypothetical protein